MSKYISTEIEKEINKYWDEVLNCDLRDYVSEALKVAFKKWTTSERKKKKRSLKKAHRGTNYNTKKPRKGYLRVKAPGGKSYIYKRLTGKEKVTKKRVGKRLGEQQQRFK